MNSKKKLKYDHKKGKKGKNSWSKKKIVGNNIQSHIFLFLLFHRQPDFANKLIFQLLKNVIISLFGAKFRIVLNFRNLILLKIIQLFVNISNSVMISMNFCKIYFTIHCAKEFFSPILLNTFSAKIYEGMLIEDTMSIRSSLLFVYILSTNFSFSKTATISKMIYGTNSTIYLIVSFQYLICSYVSFKSTKITLSTQLEKR